MTQKSTSKLQERIKSCRQWLYNLMVDTMSPADREKLLWLQAETRRIEAETRVIEEKSRILREETANIELDAEKFNAKVETIIRRLRDAEKKAPITTIPQGTSPRGIFIFQGFPSFSYSAQKKRSTIK